MEEAVDEGLTRSIGLSNFNSQQIQEVIDKSRIKPSVHQVNMGAKIQIRMIQILIIAGAQEIYLSLYCFGVIKCDN